MTSDGASFARSADQLIAALRRETLLAQTGALADLADAAEAKRSAFDEFRRIFMADASDEMHTTRREALRAVAESADENALVLDAVQATLGDILGRVRAALTEAADPGVYGPTSGRVRDVLAVSLDACA